MPFPIPGDLPDPGIKMTFLALAGEFFTTGNLISVSVVTKNFLLG